VFFALTAAGGCTGSTAGGAKAMRWLLVGRAILAQVKIIQSPSRLVSIKYEGKRVDEDVMSGVISFFVFYFFTLTVMSIILTLLGLDMVTAISGALTAVANVGPGLGPIIGPAGNFASLSDSVKLVLVLGMLLGRLEILTVVVLLTPVFWREALS
jgi:trk system potassium uptake protein TrkH